MTGYKDRSIRRFTEELEEADLITVERQTWKVNRYHLAPAADVACEAARVPYNVGQDVLSTEEAVADKEYITNSGKENKDKRTNSQDSMTDGVERNISLPTGEEFSSVPTQEPVDDNPSLEDDAPSLEELRLRPENRGLTDEEILARPDPADREAFDAWFMKKWRRQQAERKNQMNSVASG